MTADKKSTVLVVEDDRSTSRMVCSALQSAGLETVAVEDGRVALQLVRERAFDLVLLDLNLPGIKGLEILDRMYQEAIPCRVIVMTGDDATESVMHAVSRQAYRYILKPFSMKALVELVQTVLAAGYPSAPIEVVSALPEWIELLVPCDLESADRIRSFMAGLLSSIPENVRESIAQAFRELLLNAIEWGGQLDPQRKVRISCLRARRMLLYRIADPGPGFRMEEVRHAAFNNPEGAPTEHMRVREELKLRPGGFGILLVKSIVDELLFNEAHNEVVFVKYLD